MTKNRALNFFVGTLSRVKSEGLIFVGTFEKNARRFQILLAWFSDGRSSSLVSRTPERPFSQLFLPVITVPYLVLTSFKEDETVVLSSCTVQSGDKQMHMPECCESILTIKHIYYLCTSVPQIRSCSFRIKVLTLQFISTCRLFPFLSITAFVTVFRYFHIGIFVFFGH